MSVEHTTKDGNTEQLRQNNQTNQTFTLIAIPDNINQPLQELFNHSVLTIPNTKYKSQNTRFIEGGADGSELNTEFLSGDYNTEQNLWS